MHKLIQLFWIVENGNLASTGAQFAETVYLSKNRNPEILEDLRLFLRAVQRRDRQGPFELGVALFISGKGLLA